MADSRVLVYVYTVAYVTTGNGGSIGGGGGTPPSGYTVTFNSNGGSSVISKTGVTHGSTIIAPTAPTRDIAGFYSFGGWYKEAAITNAWIFASDTVTSNITLYAKWNPLKNLGDTSPGCQSLR
jgi:uncharacterized repeat protein (TIGR02543 family)